MDAYRPRKVQKLSGLEQTLANEAYALVAAKGRVSGVNSARATTTSKRLTIGDLFIDYSTSSGVSGTQRYKKKRLSINYNGNRVFYVEQEDYSDPKNKGLVTYIRRAGRANREVISTVHKFFTERLDESQRDAHTF
jgi:hypothetical protein